MKEDTTPIDQTWISKTGGFAKDMTMRDHYAGLDMEECVMNIEDIAEQAGFEKELHDLMVVQGMYPYNMAIIERFSAKLIAHEREECAKVAENFLAALQRDRISIADAIRARGKA